MTRRGPTKKADLGFGEARLKLARAYLKAARDELTLAEPGELANPIVSQVVNGAIAYTDALTSRFGGRVNQKDHGAAVKALREILGKRLPAAQQNRLRRILGEKDAAQYGARFKTKTEAKRLFEELEAFAIWAEAEIGRQR